MGRIAVFLRGHLRVWDLIKEVNFNFFDNLPYEVDFYIATWEYSGKKLKRLQKDFSNRNLKKFKIFPRTAEYYNPWTGPATMSAELTRERIHQQFYNNRDYKFILESRFDVALFQTSDIVKPQIFEFGSTETEGQFDPNKDYNVTGLGDHCFLSGIGAHQLMNTRILHDPGEEGNHIGMYKFAKIHGLTTFKISWFRGLIARPNIVSLKDRNSFLHEKDRLENEWQGMKTSQKIKFCEQANCDVDEYGEEYHIGKLNGTD